MDGQSSSLRVGQKQKTRKSSLGREATDLIALFTHHRPRKPEQLNFKEHIQAITGNRIYTLAQQDPEFPIVEVGEEASSVDDGFDYAVAIVNKATGATTYRPARVLNFRATFTMDVPTLLGTKRKAPIDYTKDYTLSKDEWTQKRMALIDQFASAKKNKMQEAALRRQINAETLEEMRSTAFASVSSIVKTAVDEEVKESVALVATPESNILPKPCDVENVKHIYPLSTFVTDEDVKAFGEECTSFLTQSKKEVVAAGVPEFVYSFSQAILKKTPEQAVAFCFLGAMTATLSKVRHQLFHKDFYACKVPEGVLEKVRIMFIERDWELTAHGVKKQFVNVSMQEKEKLLAHAIALALSLSPTSTVPLSPWSRDLRVPESKLVRVMTALGCAVFNLPDRDAVRFGSVRAARLVSAPKEVVKTRKFRRSGRK